MTKKTRKLIGLAAFLSASALLAAGLFLLCYRFDNKYTAVSPQTSGGVLTLDEDILERYPAVYLIQGWEIYRGNLFTPEDFSDNSSLPLPDEITFIGQYGGFEGHVEDRATARSPHGSATYRLNIALPAEQKSYTLELPEIYSAYKLYINGVLMARMGDPDPQSYAPETGNSSVTVQAVRNMEIIVAVSDYSHFYSGMVYPPVFGEPDSVAKLLNTRLGLRVAALSVALCIGLLYLCVWIMLKKDKDKNILPLEYFALCVCFALFICYPVVKTIFPGGMGFYAIENLAYCAMLLLVMLIQNRISGLEGRFAKIFVAFGIFLCSWALLVPCFIGDSFSLMMAYSNLIGAYAWVCAGFLIVSAAYGVYADAVHSKAMLTGAVVFGTALVMDRLLPMFEPIRFGWFTELAGGLLVVLIGLCLAEDVSSQFRMRIALEGRVETVSRMMEMQSAYYPIILEKEEEAKAARHDLRHHITVIRELVSGGDSGKLINYLDAYDEKHMQPSQASYCKHYVADMLLRMYAELGGRQDTPVSIKACLPERIAISDVDLCVILSNLLENALEASARIPKDKRHITVRIRLELNRLGIFVENKFDGFLETKHGRFLSGKQNGREGIGLNSVRTVCENYGGSADFYADENNVFHSEVILPVREDDAP